MFYNHGLLACALALALAGVPAKAETSFYVAADGSDANPGTRAHPFRTFERARDAVRGIGSTKTRSVVVRSGIYEFPASFLLGPPDSGSPKHPVTWEAAKGGMRP